MRFSGRGDFPDGDGFTEWRKMSDVGRDWYLEWSTRVDAPVTYGMSLDEFKRYYREEYGEAGMCGLDKRLERVEVGGTSCMRDNSVDQTIAGNRAADNARSPLTKEEIIRKYCVERPTDGSEAGEPRREGESGEP